MGGGQFVASENNCIAAVAKMMYNVLHFDVAILKSGSAFGTISGASDTKLTDAFPNAQILDGASQSQIGNDNAFWLIHNSIPAVRRNKSASDQGDGDHGGPIFAETGGLVAHGLITQMGKALFNNHKFRLSNLDSIVFAAQGLDSKLLKIERSYDWTTNPGSAAFGSHESDSITLKKIQVVSGANTAVALTNAWPTCGSGPCHPGDNQMFDFGTSGWSSAADNAALAAEIGSTSFTGSVFANQFAGTIPSEAQIAEEFVNATRHASWNRTGQKKFFVLYAKNPDWNNPYCQYNSSGTTPYTIPGSGGTTTKCTATDGTEEPAVTVDLKFSQLVPSGTAGLSFITRVDKPNSGSGKFYLQPVWNGNFAGVFSFVNKENGSFVRDEKMNTRYLKVIMDASECGVGGIPNSGAGCAQGKMYNVKGSWDCSSQPCAFNTSLYTEDIRSLTLVNSGTAPTGKTAYDLAVNYTPVMNFTPGTEAAVWAKASSTNNAASKLITVTVAAGTTSAIAAATVSPSAQSPADVSAPSFAIVPHHVCDMSGCQFAGYVLKNSAGYGTAAVASAISGIDLVDIVTMSGTTANAIRYSEAYLNTVTFSYGTGGTGTFRAVAEFANIPNGPADNPTFNCALDPYWDDADNDNVLDHTVNATTGKVTCTEATFAYAGEALNYKFGYNFYAAHPSANIKRNEANSFEYDDPASATRLIKLAFGPWLDGKTQLSSTTDLNALQAFSLIYLFLSRDSSSMWLSGILNGDQGAEFSLLMPYCQGGDCNTPFGRGFQTYHQ